MEFGQNGISIPGLDTAAGTLVLPLWAVGAAAGLLVIFLLLAIYRAGAVGMIGTIVRLAVILAVLGGAWIWLDRSSERDRVDQRNALDARALDLTARAVMPGSVLACLDARAGETVVDACEKVVFAAPETVAAAMSYVTARLALLADGIDFATRKDPTYEQVLAPMRANLEGDRFGFVSQLFAARDGCTFDKCAAFALLSDPNRVRSNLKDGVFEAIVARNATAWASRPVHTGAAPPPAGSQPVAAAAPPAGRAPLPAGYNLPSAASIPPVSIMNTEPPPSAPPAPAAAAAPAPAAAAPEAASPPPTPPRRPPRPPAPRAQANQPAPPPVSVTPPAATAAAPQRQP